MCNCEQRSRFEKLCGRRAIQSARHLPNQASSPQYRERELPPPFSAHPVILIWRHLLIMVRLTLRGFSSFREPHSLASDIFIATFHLPLHEEGNDWNRGEQLIELSALSTPQFWQGIALEIPDSHRALYTSERSPFATRRKSHRHQGAHYPISVATSSPYIALFRPEGLNRS